MPLECLRGKWETQSVSWLRLSVSRWQEFNISVRLLHMQTTNESVFLLSLWRSMFEWRAKEEVGSLTLRPLCWWSTLHISPETPLVTQTGMSPGKLHIMSVQAERCGRGCISWSAFGCLSLASASAAHLGFSLLMFIHVAKYLWIIHCGGSHVFIMLQPRVQRFF